MTKTVLKRALSFVLASMIIISSVCCIGFAQGETENKLTITSKFYKYDEVQADWVETDRADKGEDVKVRVFIDTSYYAATGNLLFFYDKALFTDSYSRDTINTAAVNGASGSFTKDYNVTAEFGFLKKAARPIQNMIANGDITQEFADAHECISFGFYPSGVTTCHKIDGSYWFAEFDLTVREDSELCEGDFFIEPASMGSPERIYASGNISVGEENGAVSDVVSMTEIQVDFEFISSRLKNYSSVKLDANGGEFENGTEITEKVALDVTFSLSDFEIPEREGYNFIGWTDDSTGEAAKESYNADYKDFSFTAEWKANSYDAVFDANGGVWADGATEKTVSTDYGAEIIAPEAPSKQGYKFIKWDKEIPATMPAENITITAVFERIFSCPDCGDEILGEDAINAHIASETRKKATVEIKNNSGSKTISYGETLRLTAVTTNLPSDVSVCWYVDGVEKGEGETFNVSFESGTKTVEAKLVDENGEVLKDASGNEISDSEKVSVNAGFFRKLISFFKNLFGMNRIIVQAFRGIF